MTSEIRSAKTVVLYLLGAIYTGKSRWPAAFSTSSHQSTQFVEKGPPKLLVYIRSSRPFASDVSGRKPSQGPVMHNTVLPPRRRRPWQDEAAHPGHRFSGRLLTFGNQPTQ